MPGLLASAFAAIAAVVASLDGDADVVPFFVGLAFAGGVGAWASIAPRPRITQALALSWLLAAAWVAVLIVMAVSMGSGPAPTPENTYLGLPALADYLVAVFAGAVLMLVLAFRQGLGRQAVLSQRE